MTIVNSIYNALKKRILVLDGAMGTMIQNCNLTEKDYRGNRFANYEIDLKGNNDLLSITQTDIIAEIHDKYLAAGADIISTNTFNANRISMADYKMENFVYEMNFESAKIAKKAAIKYSKIDKNKPRFVAGSIGPTNRTCSISPDINNPSFRAVNFDEMAISYTEQVNGLIDGGADILLLETIFDTLNAKAALFAINNISEERDIKIPVMVSGTVVDASGRTLSGQTVEAFVDSISYPHLLSIGLNCSLGAKDLAPHLEEISKKSNCYISVHPNAGLPNQFGEYDETAKEMAILMKEFVGNKFVNLIGGCCGTSPEHVLEFVKLAENAEIRTAPSLKKELKLSGLESLTVSAASNFVNIGERTNVSGSRKFARLIREKKYEEALEIAKNQVEGGAQIIDVNLDDAMLDTKAEMANFLNLIASEPEIAKLPIMIDSSKWEVIEAGLKCCQGKAVVNSISLKEGEKDFISKAKKVKAFGAAVVVMAFDENGQATSFDRKIEICERAYKILTEKVKFYPQDIIFDPNILTIATALEEHNNYAIDFIDATRWIKNNLPYAKVSGGISNLSFSFRGNNTIREAMHSVFLYHAIKAGLDMGIVNAGMLQIYDEIPKDLLALVQDLIFNKRNDATERLLAFAENVTETKEKQNLIEEWRQLKIAEKLSFSLVKGIDKYIEEDIDEALKTYENAVTIIENPLMAGMNKVGDLFGSGEMFLPQVVKSARVMKKAVSKLQPYLEAEKQGNETITHAEKILLATVKGDVHDIGKNIVGVVLGCNNYEVIDIGVMVSAEKILQTAREKNVDIIGLSGLITPSLEEMVHVAKEMQKQGMKIPLLIGGATTSEIHTAVKICQNYDAAVIHVRDASKAVGVVANLLSVSQKEKFLSSVDKKYKELKDNHLRKISSKKYISISEANKNGLKLEFKNNIKKPIVLGTKVIKSYSIEEISKYIDWTYFFHAWKITGKYPAIFNDSEKGEEAKKLFDDAQAFIAEIISKKMLEARAVVGLFPANSSGNNIEVYENENVRKTIANFAFLRNQELKSDGQPNLCLSDFISPSGENQDYIGFFALTTGIGIEKWIKHFEGEGDDYNVLMLKILADRLAEAFAEFLHEKVRKEFWGYSKNENFEMEDLQREKYQGIRPAPGYPACPSHFDKKTIFEILDIEEKIGMKLTENFAMYPAASVCGFYFAHPDAKYFNVGKISKDQLNNFALTNKIEVEEAEKILRTNLNY